jgi:DeoR/GlpR family transcriptional regulator of sugar metabolism
MSAAAASMLGAERARVLRKRLAENGALRVAEEAKRFGVSEETIRRDIKRLSAEGVADMVFGGAVLRASSPLPPIRERRQEAAKAAIARAAIGLVEPGQVVILDAGTTALALAPLLAGIADLTIVTNSLPAATLLAAAPHVATYLIGGRLVPDSMSLIGPQAERELAEINAHWAFLGAAAIEVGGALTSADPYEASVKRAMIGAAQRTAVLADANKFGSRRVAPFARVGDLDCLVTTPDAPAEVRSWIEGAGARLILSEAVEEQAP